MQSIPRAAVEGRRGLRDRFLSEAGSKPAKWTAGNSTLRAPSARVKTYPKDSLDRPLRVTGGHFGLRLEQAEGPVDANGCSSVMQGHFCDQCRSQLHRPYLAAMKMPFQDKEYPTCKRSIRRPRHLPVPLGRMRTLLGGSTKALSVPDHPRRDIHWSQQPPPSATNPSARNSFWPRRIPLKVNASGPGLDARRHGCLPVSSLPDGVNGAPRAGYQCRQPSRFNRGSRAHQHVACGPHQPAAYRCYAARGRRCVQVWN